MLIAEYRRSFLRQAFDEKLYNMTNKDKQIPWQAEELIFIFDSRKLV